MRRMTAITLIGLYWATSLVLSDPGPALSAGKTGTEFAIVTQKTGWISGRALTTSGKGAKGVRVQVRRRVGKTWKFEGGLVYTDAAGRYKVKGLVAGTYRLQFYDVRDVYSSQCYRSVPCVSLLDSRCTNIAVRSGKGTILKDARLTKAAHISGRVMANGTTVAGAEARFYRKTGTTWVYVDKRITDAAGVYRTVSLPPGSYRLKFTAEGYLISYYGSSDATSISDSGCKSVMVGAGASARNVDVSLLPTPRMRPGLDWYSVPDLPAKLGLTETELLALGGIAFGDDGALLGGVVKRGEEVSEVEAWISTSVPEFAPITIPRVTDGIPEHIVNDPKSRTLFLTPEVSAGGGRYIIEAGNRVLTSSDTAMWRIDKPLADVVGTYGKYDLVFLSGGGVAASTAGFCYVGGGMLSAPPHDNIRRFACLWTSLDGVDWSLPPYSPSLLGAGVLVECRGVTWGPNGWIAVGAREEGGNLVSGPEVWRSAGGAVWEVAHPGDERPGYGGLRAVAASDDLYVAVGCETPAPLVNEVDITPFVLTSPNGITWTRHALGTVAETGGMRLDEVAHGPAGFLTIGTLTRNAMQSPVVWLSADGASWQQIHLWPPTDVNAGYFNKLRYVAGSDRGYAIVGSRLDKPVLWLSGDFAVDWEPSAASVDASGTP